MKNNDSESVFAYAAAPNIELIGNSECRIDHLKSIDEYTEEKIKVNLGKYAVTVFGDSLTIPSFSPEGAVIEGTIVSLEFVHG